MDAEIHRVRQEGEAYYVEGAQDGRRSAITVSAKTVQELERAGGEEAVRRYFREGLAMAREDKVREYCHQEGIEYREPRRR
jgi:hypothetical protein